MDMRQTKLSSEPNNVIARKWRAKNRVKHREYMREYMKRYYANNPEAKAKHHARAKAWYQRRRLADPEAINEYYRTYRAKHPEQVKAYAKRYRERQKTLNQTKGPKRKARPLDPQA